MELRATAIQDCEDNLMHAGPYIHRDRQKIHLDLNESHYPIPERVEAWLMGRLPDTLACTAGARGRRCLSVQRDDLQLAVSGELAVR